jgi:hypothetical protein
MTEPRAMFQATYSDFKNVKTRGVVQFVFEVPHNEAKHAFDVLGGPAEAAKEVWVVIARLAPEAVKRPPERAEGPKKGPTLSQVSALLGEEPAFHRFLEDMHGAEPVTNADEAAVEVRRICKVDSRAEFDTDPHAAARWRSLETEYKAWSKI